MATETFSVNNNSATPKTGSVIGNNLITITGSGFNNYPTIPVNFGTKGSTKVTILNDNSLTAVSPNTNQVGTVEITIPVGGETYNAGTFTYEGPQITSVHPSATDLLGNKKIVLKGSNLKGVDAVQFGPIGVQQEDITIISDTEIHVINPPGQKVGVLNVVATDSVGLKSPEETLNQFKYVKVPNLGVPFIFNAKDKDNTYIQFLGDNTIDGYYYDKNGAKQQLAVNTGYLLSDLVSSTPVLKDSPTNVPAVLVKAFSGRVYVCFDKPFPVTDKEPIPNANSSSAGVRYQYFEPTVDDSQLNIDLSYIDFTSISLSMTGRKAPHGTNLNQDSQSSKTLIDAAAASAKTKDGSVLPSKDDMFPKPSFLRIISPQLGNEGLYHDFTHYLTKFLLNKEVHINGTYVGTVKKGESQPTGNKLTQAQCYNYKGTFTANGITLKPLPGSGNGSAAGISTKQRGPGVGDTDTDIVIKFSDLNKNSGVYGCNVGYVAAGVSYKEIQNDFYGQVVGDLLAGLNFGYVGSETVFNKGAKIGDLYSTQWWGGTLADGTTINSKDTPGGQGIYFSGVQSDSNCYNSYSDSIAKLTTGYGFPLQDRLGKNLMTLNTSIDNDAYVEVWIDKEPVQDY